MIPPGKTHSVRLCATFVRTVSVPGRYGDGYGGHGLSLLVTPRKSGGFSKTGAQAISPNGAKTSLGLGSYPVVTLAMARERSLANARAIAEGRDPRRRMQRVPIFEKANETVVAIHARHWKSGRTEGQWRASMRDYVLPRLARKRVDAVTTADVMAVLPDTERLKEMMDAAAMAFLVLTGEDEQADGQLHARMNVIREVGLFQGRLGFRRAIVILEKGCEAFSNIDGLGQLRFATANIKGAVDLSAAKGLIEEMSAAPARAPDIAREQLPDTQSLLDACLRLHGVEGRIKVVGTSSAIPAGEVGGSVRRAGAAGITEDLTARQPLSSHEVVRGVDHGHVPLKHPVPPPATAARTHEVSWRMISDRYPKARAR